MEAHHEEWIVTGDERNPRCMSVSSTSALDILRTADISEGDSALLSSLSTNSRRLNHSDSEASLRRLSSISGGGSSEEDEEEWSNVKCEVRGRLEVI